MKTEKTKVENVYLQARCGVSLTEALSEAVVLGITENVKVVITHNVSTYTVDPVVLLAMVANTENKP